MPLPKVPASTLSALHIGYGDVEVVEINNIDDLKTLNSLYNDGRSIHVLGDGTNTVFGSYSGVVAKINLRGNSWLNDTTLKISSGEPWQKAVDLSVEKDLYGIERMSAVPGKVGAAPVQNIGCFKQLLSDVLLELEVYDYANGEYKVFGVSECGFGEHRSSNFKKSPAWATYIVTSITIKLKDYSSFTPPMGIGVENFMALKNYAPKNAKQSEQAIREFRESLYPDYTKIPNTGSYFTHFEIRKKVLQDYPEEIMNITHRDSPDGLGVHFKCEDLLKSIGINEGFEFAGGLKMYEQHNSFLLNPDSTATVDDLIAFHDYVNSRLYDKYRGGLR
jgi:UDP-N-acetylmuramate dehydrogenase